MRSVVELARSRCETKAVLLLTAVCMYLLIAEPSVFSSYRVVLVALATSGLVAVGLTGIVVEGQIDLSVGSVVVVAGGVVARLDAPLLLVVTAALVISGLVGLCNWILVCRCGMNSFIATLGTMIAGAGVALLLTNSAELPLGHPQVAESFSSNLLGPITPSVLIFLLGACAVHIFLSRMKVGREFFAVGGNASAASDLGVPVSRRLLGGFLISSLCAGVVGVCQTLSLATAEPTASSNILLLSLAAVIIGGAVLSGGKGSIPGTVLAALALVGLETGLDFAGITGDSQDVFVGLVLLATIVIDRDNLQGLRVDILQRHLPRFSFQSPLAYQFKKEK